VERGRAGKCAADEAIVDGRPFFRILPNVIMAAKKVSGRRWFSGIHPAPQENSFDLGPCRR
jgi:hypothetical protein